MNASNIIPNPPGIVKREFMLLRFFAGPAAAVPDRPSIIYRETVQIIPVWVLVSAIPDRGEYAAGTGGSDKGKGLELA